MSEIFFFFYNCLNSDFPEKLTVQSHTASIDNYDIGNFEIDVPRDDRPIKYKFELDDFQTAAIRLSVGF